MLRELNVDPNNQEQVGEYVADLLGGLEIQYTDLEIGVPTTSIGTRALNMQMRRVEVVEYDGDGFRNGEYATFSADLFMWDGSMWITMDWHTSPAVVEGHGFALPSKERRAGMFYQPQTNLTCKCDKSGGTVNGAACTGVQCEELKTCKDAAGVTGSCALFAVKEYVPIEDASAEE